MTEKHQILARKYRPQSFSEVIGQKAIVTTIKNSIRLKRLAHAYLFSGSRGTGKTTLARLFAKSLNCQNPTEDFEPCNQCRSCTEIAGSRSLDVLEIDGASNRGIDDIRQINETIGYAPSSGKYKIYIIDEVHMLTKEAFNALLKTLEEPPPSIKFFFATTEPHKVLPTIISRCQRFELSRIQHGSIVQKLKSITVDMQRDVDEEALHLIANFSEGSLRDAESILDQILCYHEEKIDSEVINNALGFIPQDYFFELDKAVKEKNPLFAFEFVDKMFKSGKDLSYLLEELIEHYRHTLIVKMKEDKRLDLSDELHQKYKEASQTYTEEQSLYILDFLIHSMQQLQKSSFKKITLEMLLLKIINSSNRIPIDSLIKRLKSLEKNISSQDENPLPPVPIEEKVSLKPIAFNIEKQEEEKLPPEKITEDINERQRYDTLMRFAAVELEGVHKTEDDNS